MIFLQAQQRLARRLNKTDGTLVTATGTRFKELALATSDYSRQHVYAVATGRVKPSEYCVAALCRATKLPREDILAPFDTKGV